MPGGRERHAGAAAFHRLDGVAQDIDERTAKFFPVCLNGGKSRRKDALELHLQVTLEELDRLREDIVDVAGFDLALRHTGKV